MPKEVECISFMSQKVGKRIKSTKLRHSWRFRIFCEHYDLELLISKLSGKREVRLNGSSVHTSNKMDGPLEFSIFLGKLLEIFYEDNRYQLKIDGKSFDEFLKEDIRKPKSFTQAPKTRRDFRPEETEVYSNLRQLTHTGVPKEKGLTLRPSFVQEPRFTRKSLNQFK